jgi:hypothetical protein
MRSDPLLLSDSLSGNCTTTGARDVRGEDRTDWDKANTMAGKRFEASIRPALNESTPQALSGAKALQPALPGRKR